MDLTWWLRRYLYMRIRNECPVFLVPVFHFNYECNKNLITKALSKRIRKPCISLIRNPCQNLVRKPCQNLLRKPCQIRYENPVVKTMTGLSYYESPVNFSVRVDIPPWKVTNGHFLKVIVIEKLWTKLTTWRTTTNWWNP
jgi:hypothetical protein